MGNLLTLTERSVQTRAIAKLDNTQIDDVLKRVPDELKLTDGEAQMLKHDVTEVTTSFAQLGLMVVGLIPGWGEPADVASATMDFATGHPISGTISMFCACPVAGYIGDIPLLGIRIYRVFNSSFRCGKTMYVIAKSGNRLEKSFVWMGKRVIEVSNKNQSVKVVQKNFFANPVSSKLYIVFEQLEKEIAKITNDIKARNYGKHLEYVRFSTKKK